MVRLGLFIWGRLQFLLSVSFVVVLKGSDFRKQIVGCLQLCSAARKLLFAGGESYCAKRRQYVPCTCSWVFYVSLPLGRHVGSSTFVHLHSCFVFASLRPFSCFPRFYFRFQQATRRAVESNMGWKLCTNGQSYVEHAYKKRAA